MFEHSRGVAQPEETGRTWPIVRAQMPSAVSLPPAVACAARTTSAAVGLTSSPTCRRLSMPLAGGSPRGRPAPGAAPPARSRSRTQCVVAPTVDTVRQVAARPMPPRRLVPPDSPTLDAPSRDARSRAGRPAPRLARLHYVRFRRTGTYDRRPFTVASPRACQVCGVAIPRQRKYCSGACVAAGRSGRPAATRKEPVKHSCDVCGTTILATNNHWRRYCSEPCRSLVSRLRRYGVAVEEYQSLLTSQAGRCAVCGTADERLVIDHHHGTGRVRGLLCGGCNIGIGSLGDSATRLALAAQYVARHALPEVVDGLGELDSA